MWFISSVKTIKYIFIVCKQKLLLCLKSTVLRQWAWNYLYGAQLTAKADVISGSMRKY